MLNKASNFDHKYDISFSPTQYIRNYMLLELWRMRAIQLQAMLFADDMIIVAETE